MQICSLNNKENTRKNTSEERKNDAQPFKINANDTCQIVIDKLKV